MAGGQRRSTTSSSTIRTFAGPRAHRIVPRRRGHQRRRVPHRRGGPLGWSAAVAAGFFGWRLATRAGRSARRSGRWPAWRSRGWPSTPGSSPDPTGTCWGAWCAPSRWRVRAGPGLEPGDRELAAGRRGAPRHVLSLAVVGALLITAVSPALAHARRPAGPVHRRRWRPPGGPRIGYSSKPSCPCSWPTRRPSSARSGPTPGCSTSPTSRPWSTTCSGWTARRATST